MNTNMSTDMNTPMTNQQVDYRTDLQSSPQALSCRPVKAAVIGFLVVTGATVAISTARAMGFIDVFDERRGLGIAIGAMAVVVGNFLPKTRGLRLSVAGSAETAAAERFAGWTLVLVGSAFIASFLFAPLSLARLISATLGIGAMLTIAANWAWQTRGALSHGPLKTKAEGAFAPTMEGGRKRSVMAHLLLAFTYVFATACAKFLLGNTGWAGEITSYLTMAFAVAFVMLRCSPAFQARN